MALYLFIYLFLFQLLPPGGRITGFFGGTCEMLATLAAVVSVGLFQDHEVCLVSL